MLKGVALETAKDLLRGGPAFTARAKLGSVLPLGGGESIRVRRGTSDLEVVRQIYRDEQYVLPQDVQTRRAKRFETAIRSSGKVPVIVDAGANIGAAALWFAREYPQARIVGVEPDSSNAAMARANCAGNDRIEIVEAAIGGEPGFVSVESDVAAYAVTTERAESGCRIVTVDECVGMVENGELFAVKIDIEGFEDDLFAANTDWLDCAKLVYIEPHDHIFPERATSRNFQAEMGRRDFDLLIKGENLIYVRREEQKK
ncbi:FkbM family methyltransferase [Qipengyuania sphaerica]|uniref:FkbM family methyltransferase n=1 Tax=Qipengyuania sphaerica TaxID=2867243 RepID=UPI001C889485|nr:FkbM family methyltransferase [Qipengyuania sphaerica]MBX7539941.1 FkbM family methyltransferase [Qipengyuania sphaerica]